MATAIPALRGKFGTTEYWLTTMYVADLASKIRLPKDMPGWEDLGLEDKYQRNVDLKRVAKIAPYFANDENRFTGALVLAVLNHESISFNVLTDFPGTNSLPGIYETAARDFGFLTMTGEELLVPIDGQHRAKAFQFALDGTNDKMQEVKGVRSNTNLAKDQVAVILIRFDEKVSRYIFNKINRYAKPTSKSDNLATDDDDAMAVLTRELIGEDGLLPARLIKISSNTLAANACEFTTHATFHEANLAFVKGLGIQGAGKPEDMDDEQRRVVRGKIFKAWELLFIHIDLFAEALNNKTQNGDSTRISIREKMLLGKPIGQLALVEAFLKMRKGCPGVSEVDLCDRLNRIDWRITADIWKGVLVAQNNRVLSGKTTVNRAALYIAYLGGVQLTATEREAMLEAIHGADWRNHELPPPVA